MSVRSSKSQVKCAAALTSISTASAHQGFPDSPRVLPFHLFPVSFPNQSYRTCVSQVLQNHLSCFPESWDCPLPHDSIIPMSCSLLGRAVGQQTPICEHLCQPSCCSGLIDTKNLKPTGILSAKHSASTPLGLAIQDRGKFLQQSQTSSTVQ